MNLHFDHIESRKQRFAEAIAAKKGVSNPLITETDIIAKVGLQNGQRVYDRINLNDNGTNVYPERKLMDGHMFLPMYASYKLTELKVSGSPTYFDANLDFFTYPDDNYFTDTDATNVNSDCLKSIFHGGSLSIEVDGTKVMREVSSHHFLFSPERPWQSAAASGETRPVPQGYGSTLEERGYKRLGNEIILTGGEDNKLVVSLGAGNVLNLVGGNVVATKRTELIIFLYGLWWPGDVKKTSFCALT